jgi:hypothetical protein
VIPERTPTLQKSTLFFSLLILSAGLFGCGSAAPSQSSFKENFTIGAIVEDNAQYLIPSSRVLFGSEHGSPELFTQKQEEIVFQIEPADLSAFLAAIRSGIEESIINSGASIVGRGSGGVNDTSFSIQYRVDEAYGVINVWGVRGEGTTYTLIVLITEG